MQRVFDCDPAKRKWIAQERKFDLMQMADFFDDQTRIDFEHMRFDYGEERRFTVGRALGSIFTVVYTMREPFTWLITAWPAHRNAWPAHRKERERHASR